MAPYKESKRVKFSETLENGTRVYKRQVDPEWTVGAVPFGGYTLGILTNAAVQSQASTAHPDPVHLNVQFLRPVSIKEIEVHVKTVRTGKQFTNLAIDLIQAGVLAGTSSFIFGNLSPSTTLGPSYPVSHTPICPLVTHPGTLNKVAEETRLYGFERMYSYVQDPYFRRLNASMLHSRSSEGLQMGTWVQLGEDPIEADEVGFFIDIGRGPASVLPDDLSGETKDWWYPTLNLYIEFKVKFPLGGLDAPSTFGLFERRRQMENGRHSETVELWTSPSAIGGEGVKGENWREKMTCVAIGGQMGLIVSPTTNLRNVVVKSQL